MITEIVGKVIHKAEQSLTVDVNGLCYEILIPVSVMQRVDQHIDAEGGIRLKTYHYIQISPSTGMPAAGAA